MTSKLPITLAQMKVLVRAAKEGDCVVEVQKGDLIFRVIPTAIDAQRAPEIDFDDDDAL